MFFFWIFQKFPLIEKETWVYVHDGIAVKMGKRKVSVLARTLKCKRLLPPRVHFLFSVKVIIHTSQGGLIKIIYV